NTDITFVAADGNDSTCSPCQTLQGAHDHTNPYGTIIVKHGTDGLDPTDGEDLGIVTITKPITIDGAGINAIIRVGFGQAGIFINNGVGPVTIRNLRIHATGGYGPPYSYGIFATGSNLFIENVSVTGTVGYGLKASFPGTPVNVVASN